MGYRSVVQLVVVSDDKDLREIIINDFMHLSKDAEWSIDEDGLGIDESRWSYLSSEMRLLSEMHPSIILEAYRKGEEVDDFEVIYAFAGKIQSEYGVVEYGKFNITKLK